MPDPVEPLHLERILKIESEMVRNARDALEARKTYCAAHGHRPPLPDSVNVCQYCFTRLDKIPEKNDGAQTRTRLPGTGYFR